MIASESTMTPSKSKRSARFTALRAAEVVFDADDVVLAEVLAVLHLDEDEELGPRIGDAVGRPERDVDGRVRRDLDVDAVERDETFTGHDEPVLRALVVLLVAQALTGQDLEA